jgi:hypothetical protein
MAAAAARAAMCVIAVMTGAVLLYTVITYAADPATALAWLFGILLGLGLTALGLWAVLGTGRETPGWDGDITNALRDDLSEQNRERYQRIILSGRQ